MKHSVAKNLVIVKVRFFASLKEELGVAILCLKLERPDFDHLLRELGFCLGSKSSILIKDGSLKEGIMVAIDNELIPPSQINKVKLKDGCTVDFMPPPSGG